MNISNIKSSKDLTIFCAERFDWHGCKKCELKNLCMKFVLNDEGLVEYIIKKNRKKKLRKLLK